MARFSDLVAFTREAIIETAPDDPGIYEIGYWVEPTYFVPRYLGRARGKLTEGASGNGTTIRRRLLKHVRNSHNDRINRARKGRHLAHWLHDPDESSTEGLVKMDIDRKLLWCRWMVARHPDQHAAIASSREASLLASFGIGEATGVMYVWNKRL